MTAVAHGLEDAHGNIIEEYRQAAVEIRPEVGDGVGQHIRRRTHPPQQLGCQHHAHHRQDQAAGDAEGQTGVDGQLEIFPVPSAVVLGDQHARAQGGALQEADNHKDQIGRGTDGGQGLLADKVADDQGVGGVVELLEQIAQEDGDGEGHQPLPDGALQHG